MPRSPRSLQITDLYRRRLIRTRTRLDQQARRTWPTIDRFDSTDWPQRMAAAVSQAQAEAVRASGGYLTAFLTSELGRRTSGPTLDSLRYSGLSSDGRPLVEAFQSPLIAARAALKNGDPPMEALAYGLNRAVRLVSVDFDNAHRTALLDAIGNDDRFSGWQRATSGTCGACLAASAEDGAVHFEVHPNCECVSEPIVRDVPDLAPRLVGAALFASMTPQHQDDVLGPETAALVRDGKVPLAKLKHRTPLEQGQDFITQAPIAALTATTDPGGHHA